MLFTRKAGDVAAPLLRVRHADGAAGAACLWVECILIWRLCAAWLQEPRERDRGTAEVRCAGTIGERALPARVVCCVRRVSLSALRVCRRSCTSLRASQACTRPVACIVRFRARCRPPCTLPRAAVVTPADDASRSVIGELLWVDGDYDKMLADLDRLEEYFGDDDPANQYIRCAHRV